MIGLESFEILTIEGLDRWIPKASFALVNSQNLSSGGHIEDDFPQICTLLQPNYKKGLN